MTARKPGRPRSAEADEAILRTTLELLATEGLQGLSVETVAERAGVGKTTIYRRWPTKRELIVAALATVASAGELVATDTGSVRGDLLEFARRRRAAIRRARSALVMPRLVAESATDPELHRLVRQTFVDPVRAPLVAALRRGVDRGELRADLDLELAADLFAGAFVYRLLVSGGRVPSLAVTEQVIDVLLAGAAA